MTSIEIYLVEKRAVDETFLIGGTPYRRSANMEEYLARREEKTRKAKRWMGILGALTGGAAGAISGSTYSGLSKDRKNLGRNMILGTAAGGLLGGIGTYGLARSGLNHLQRADDEWLKMHPEGVHDMLVAVDKK